MRILVVDDEKSIRITLKEILEFEGHEITVASDGVEGLDKVKGGQFDAIFCDIKMPNMDGKELFSYILQRLLCPLYHLKHELYKFQTEELQINQMDNYLLNRLS